MVVTLPPVVLVTLPPVVVTLPPVVLVTLPLVVLATHQLKEVCLFHSLLQLVFLTILNPTDQDQGSLSSMVNHSQYFQQQVVTLCLGLTSRQAQCLILGYLHSNLILVQHLTLDHHHTQTPGPLQWVCLANPLLIQPVSLHILGQRLIRLVPRRLVFPKWVPHTQQHLHPPQALVCTRAVLRSRLTNLRDPFTNRLVNFLSLVSVALLHASFYCTVSI